MLTDETKHIIKKMSILLVALLLGAAILIFLVKSHMKEFTLDDVNIILSKERLIYIHIICIVFILYLIGCMMITYSIFSKKIYKYKYLDTLTGLININKLRLELDSIHRKGPVNEYALVYFDIDNFKFINDKLGHDEGSDILRFVSKGFTENLRPKETLCRITADKFIALLTYESSTDENERKAILQRLGKINETVGSFLNRQGFVTNLTFSFGIHRIKKDLLAEDIDINRIIDKGNAARKNAKGFHETTYVFYSDIDESVMIREREIEARMRSSLENGEFIIYLQPKFDLKTNRVAGAEALIRWLHPEEGFLSPMEFIPLFEKNGFINYIDEYVFEMVCKTIRHWIDKKVDTIPISVNVSRGHLISKNFVRNYKNILRKYEIPSRFIEIEITESIAIDNVESVVDVINSLRKNGFSIAMDDFGAGYSSLNILRNIDVDVLKLDREFFVSVDDNERWKKVVSGIVSLAKSMEIKVVSEGVETREQADFLKEIGCDMAQGYLFAIPMPIVDFEDMLRVNNKVTN